MYGRMLRALTLGSCLACTQQAPPTTQPDVTRLVLAPVPDQAPTSLHAALWTRRSSRTFGPGEVSRTDIGQLVWAAQGINDPARGRRTSPSAGALYPLEIYVVTGQGVYHYLPDAHALERTVKRDVRRALSASALGQPCVRQAPLVMAVAGVVSRTQVKYGSRARRYVYMEAGHAAQNVLLMATGLGLGAVPVGAFDDDQVARVLELPPGHDALYLIPIGRPMPTP